MKERSVRIRECEREVELGIGQKTYRMYKSKGWIYLLELLRHPGQTRFAGTFLAAVNPIPDRYRKIGELSDTERLAMGLHSHLAPLRIQMADDQAIREISSRLTYLIEMEATLRTENNLAALDDILSEKQKLQEYLSQVLKPGGKIRCFGEHSSRDMRAVYMAISRCLDGISKVEPALGEYLRSRVKMWHLLCYEPGEIEISVL